jgi:hypothetical protein
MAQCYLQPGRTSVVDVDHSEGGTVVSVVTLSLGKAMKEIAYGYVVIKYSWP